MAIHLTRRTRLRLPALAARWPFLAPLRLVEGFGLRHTAGIAHDDAGPFYRIGELVARLDRHDAQFFECGAHILRHRNWPVGHAVAADVNEVPLRRSGGLVVAEDADLEAHAGGAEMRDAQAAMDGVRKRDRAEILAARLDH